MPFDRAFSPLHWLIIAVVALIVLGSERLPQAGRGIARTVRFLRDTDATLQEEFLYVLDLDEAMV